MKDEDDDGDEDGPREAKGQWENGGRMWTRLIPLKERGI
jgi:hypothetical protein